MEGPTTPSLAAIRWQCRRGMLELDAILLPFFSACYHVLSSAEQAQFARLLKHPDPELLSWLLGSSVPVDAALGEMVGAVRAWTMRQRQGGGGDPTRE